jgi:hypothetical protein
MKDQPMPSHKSFFLSYIIQLLTLHQVSECLTRDIEV